MSEYLDRLKQRRDATPPPGNAPNVQSNVSFRKAIDYIELLETDLDTSRLLARKWYLKREADNVRANNLENQEAYLLERLRLADEKYTELCDEMRVQGELNEMDLQG